MKKAILVATIGAMTLSVNAGDWGKAPVDKTPIVEECIDLGGEISVGYASHYIFKGVRLAGDSVLTDVNYTFDNLSVPITIGATYINGINDSAVGAGFDKLDLYVSAALGTFAGFDVALGYTHFSSPEVRGAIVNSGIGFGELGVDVRRSLGFVDLAFQSAYAMGGAANGWYHQLGIEKSFGITDSVSLVLGTGVAYSDNYFSALTTNDSDWNHYYATASLPIQLNCRTTLTPYVGYIGNGGVNGSWVTSGVFGDGTPQGDVLHGGVTLSVTF